MITPEDLAEAFGRNVWVVRQQAAGLTDEESLIQPPSGGNCLNWVVGHIVSNRNNVLAALGAEPVVPSDAQQRYRRGSEPVIGAGEGRRSLGDLLDQLDRAQEAVAAALARATPEALAANAPGRDDTTVGKSVFFLYFHECYHVGQTELLRQLAGRTDKII